MTERRDSNSAQLTALASLGALLTDARVDYWVFGGWAVDLHAARITREHHDLDIVVHVDDLDRVVELLHDSGWEDDGGSRADGYLAFANDGVHLELAFIARDDDGTIYTPLPDGRAPWPVDALGDDVGHVAGVHAHVITLDALIEEKSTDHGDDTAAAKDRADLEVLESLRPEG